MNLGNETEKALNSKEMDQSATNENSQPSGIVRTEVPWQEQYRSSLHSSRNINQTSVIRRT